MWRGLRTFLVARMVKNLPAMQETWFWSLGGEDPLGKGMATHSSILAWRIPWTEQPGGEGPQMSHGEGALVHISQTWIGGQNPEYLFTWSRDEKFPVLCSWQTLLISHKGLSGEPGCGFTAHSTVCSIWSLAIKWTWFERGTILDFSVALPKTSAISSQPLAYWREVVQPISWALVSDHWAWSPNSTSWSLWSLSWLIHT